MHRNTLNHCGRWHTSYWCQYHVIGRQGQPITTNLFHSRVALLWFQRRAFLSDTNVSWPDQVLVRLVGAGECELRLNVPRQCWAGGFICSDRLLTVCDDERQLWVGARHWLFSWQSELWRPEEARACISRPPLLLILPSKVHHKAPDIPCCSSHALQTLAETWWRQSNQVLHWFLCQHLKFLSHQYIILQWILFSLGPNYLQLMVT